MEEGHFNFSTLVKALEENIEKPQNTQLDELLESVKQKTAVNMASVSSNKQQTEELVRLCVITYNIFTHVQDFS